MNRILVVLQKEWLELRQDRLIIFGTLIPAVLITLLPLIGLWAVRGAPDQPVRDNILTSNNPALVGLTGQEFAQVVLGQQLSILFFLLPLFIPSVIAAYSIVGEKMNRTLEPLLATAMQSWQLLTGKSLAALIPSVVVTWGLGGVFIVGIRALAVSPRVIAEIISPGWVIVWAFCTPLITLIVIALMVTISSRVNDPRTAQQISSVLIVPLVGATVGQVTGKLVLSPVAGLIGTVVLGALAFGSLWFASRLFQREAILTRWR
jgi:ABC-2 type transport system permease protein